MKIMIIEDDEFLENEICDILNRWGYKICYTQNIKF